MAKPPRTRAGAALWLTRIANDIRSGRRDLVELERIESWGDYYRTGEAFKLSVSNRMNPAQMRAARRREKGTRRRG